MTQLGLAGLTAYGPALGLRDELGLHGTVALGFSLVDDEGAQLKRS